MHKYVQNVIQLKNCFIHAHNLDCIVDLEIDQESFGGA